MRVQLPTGPPLKKKMTKELLDKVDLSDLENIVFVVEDGYGINYRLDVKELSAIENTLLVKLKEYNA